MAQRKPRVPAEYEDPFLYCRTFGLTWRLGGTEDQGHFYQFIGQDQLPDRIHQESYQVRTLQQGAAGEVARALRELSWTQTRLSAEVGLSLKHVNEVLRGKSGVSVEMLDDWARAMGYVWEVRLRKLGK